MTPKMAEELNCGVMAATTTENTGMAKSMEGEFTTGQMAQGIQVLGNKMKCTEKVNLYGRMVVATKVSSQWA